MRKFVVITTINPKSEGIVKFEQMKDWQIIIVGDKKSVPIQSSDNLTFLSIEDQQKLGYEVVERCPYNHYARKNIGYLRAIQLGADVIYDTDDDNVPYPHWNLETFSCDKYVSDKDRFINIYQYFTQVRIWPRGYPLSEIRKSLSSYRVSEGMLPIGVWQGLADLDPDVDAIYRLISNEQVKFDDKPPIALPKGRYSPFNSQNTFWHRSTFPYLYLPATTSFRFTDILRSYIAQTLMWSQGLHLGFTKATVYQKRNAHSLMKDFEEEIECYLNVSPIVGELSSLELFDDPLRDLENVYETLVDKDFVERVELDMCRAWISDYQRVSN